MRSCLKLAVMIASATAFTAAATAQPTFENIYSPDDVYEGNYSVRIEWTNPWAAGMDLALDKANWLVPLDGNTEYTLKFWAKEGTLDDVLGVRTAAFDSADAWLGDGADEWFNLTDDWAEYSHTFTTPANTAGVNFRISMVNTGGGAAFLDAFTLEDSGSNPVLFPDGDFEEMPEEPDPETSSATSIRFMKGEDDPFTWRFFAVNGAIGKISRVTNLEEVETSIDTWELYH